MSYIYYYHSVFICCAILTVTKTSSDSCADHIDVGRIFYNQYIRRGLLNCSPPPPKKKKELQS